MMLGVAEARQRLLNIFHAALDSVNGETVVSRHVRQSASHEPVHVVAIGKAAASMYAGAQAGLGEMLVRGLIITKYGHVPTQFPPNVQCLESAHPVPDEQSLAAGQALLTFIAETPPDGQLLFLISGGASALVEVLPAGMSAADLARVNAWLLGSGLDIARINRVRRALSCIKGGRLLSYLGGRPTRCYLISDVIGDDPATIGSGLLAPASGTAASIDDPTLPDWLQTFLGLAPPAPGAGDAVNETVQIEVIASLRHALQAAMLAAEAAGLTVHLHEQLFETEAASTGRRLATELIEGPAGLHIWGGESVVNLPQHPGRGGRNQQLALAAAGVLAGHDGCYLLAAGTDGTDGPTLDAGALVDAETIARGSLNACDARSCLARADAGRFLEASGDLIQTGPTGTNVMDIVLGLKQ
jgi:hydroxypyruvate reductase